MQSFLEIRSLSVSFRSGHRASAQPTIGELETGTGVTASRYVHARPVVDDVSFSIARGEALGLVGESGSGKSVTSLAIMRLLPETAILTGEIIFEGTNLLALPEQRLRRMRGSSLAMIFQEPMTALNPVLPIGEQVAEGYRAHHPKASRREARDQAIEALRAVALPNADHRYGDAPYQFSGGQRQRILLAMALVNRPKLLIADEPTTALDVTVQAQILELLEALRVQYSLSILFISHDLAVISSIADRVAVMRHGRILEMGTRQAVFGEPLHPYTRSLLGAVPTMRTDRGLPLAMMPPGSRQENSQLVEVTAGHFVRS